MIVRIPRLANAIEGRGRRKLQDIARRQGGERGPNLLLQCRLIFHPLPLLHHTSRPPKSFFIRGEQRQEARTVVIRAMATETVGCSWRLADVRNRYVRTTVPPDAYPRCNVACFSQKTGPASQSASSLRSITTHWQDAQIRWSQFPEESIAPLNPPSSSPPRCLHHHRCLVAHGLTGPRGYNWHPAL